MRVNSVLLLGLLFIVVHQVCAAVITPPMIPPPPNRRNESVGLWKSIVRGSLAGASKLTRQRFFAADNKLPPLSGVQQRRLLLRLLPIRRLCPISICAGGSSFVAGFDIGIMAGAMIAIVPAFGIESKPHL